MVLVRAINLDVWGSRPATFLAAHEVPVDFVAGKTKEFRVIDHALSFWRVSNAADLDDAILAIVASRKLIESVDIAWIDEAELRALVLLEDNPGDTLVEDLRNTHVEAAHLDMMRTAHVAQAIANAVRDQRTRIVTISEATELLQAAVDAKRVRVANLPQGLKERLRG